VSSGNGLTFSQKGTTTGTDYGYSIAAYQTEFGITGTNQGDMTFYRFDANGVPQTTNVYDEGSVEVGLKIMYASFGYIIAGTNNYFNTSPRSMILKHITSTGVQNWSILLSKDTITVPEDLWWVMNGEIMAVGWTQTAIGGAAKAFVARFQSDGTLKFFVRYDYNGNAVAKSFIYYREETIFMAGYSKQPNSVAWIASAHCVKFAYIDSERCTICPPGYTTTDVDYLICTPCTLSDYTLPGSSNCNKCPSGTYVRYSPNACANCAAGYFSNRIQSEGCTACPANYYSTAGSTSCTPCAKGSLSVAGSSTCTPCAQGTYYDTVTSNCKTCSAGTSSQSGSVSCYNCEFGKYTTNPLAGCMNCAAGTSSGQGPQLSCFSCSPGSYSVAGSICTLCPIGSISLVSGSATCAKCPPGQTTAKIGATICESCLKGSYGTDAGTCEKCPAGYFSEIDEATLCAPCPIGKYSNTIGSTFCRRCPPGQTTEAIGSQYCVPCPYGTFTSTSGSSKCFPCPAGTYGDELGMTQCKQCEPGTFASAEGQYSCIPCGQGFYNDKPGLTACFECPSGTYAPLAQNTRCESCPIGTYGDTGGAMWCKKCPINTYIDTSGGHAISSCNICPNNTYSYFGFDKCLTCTKLDDTLPVKAYFVFARFNNETTKCYLSKCPARYANEGDSIICEPCHSSCVNCSRGNDRSSCTACEKDFALIEGRCSRIKNEWIMPVLISLVVGSIIGLSFGTYIIVTKIFMAEGAQVVPIGSIEKPGEMSSERIGMDHDGRSTGRSTFYPSSPKFI